MKIYTDRHERKVERKWAVGRAGMHYRKMREVTSYTPYGLNFGLSNALDCEGLGARIPRSFRHLLPQPPLDAEWVRKRDERRKCKPGKYDW